MCTCRARLEALVLMTLLKLKSTGKQSIESHGISWHLMALNLSLANKALHLMASHGISWRLMASHGVSWHLMVSHGIESIGRLLWTISNKDSCVQPDWHVTPPRWHVKHTHWYVLMWPLMCARVVAHVCMQVLQSRLSISS